MGLYLNTYCNIIFRVCNDPDIIFNCSPVRVTDRLLQGRRPVSPHAELSCQREVSRCRLLWLPYLPVVLNQRNIVYIKLITSRYDEFSVVSSCQWCYYMSPFSSVKTALHIHTYVNNGMYAADIWLM